MVDTLHAQTSWRGLVVAPEQRCSPYDADDYRYPQSVEDRIVAELGGVYGPYTGRWFASTSDTDIEHMIARSEAHDSGLCAADLATRRRFATDLLNLTLAGPRVNRYEKVDRDAAEWQPAQNRCWFVAPGDSRSDSDTSSPSTVARRTRWTRCWRAAPRRS